MNTRTINKVLHFSVAEMRMCAYLENIKKVVPLPAIEIVPGAPNYVVGLINIAGRSVPIIDLGLRCGFIRTETYSLNVPVLLFISGDKQLAVIVDQISELTDIDDSQLQINDQFDQLDSLFLGSIIHGTESCLLINVNNLLTVSLTDKEMNDAY